MLNLISKDSSFQISSPALKKSGSSFGKPDSINTLWGLLNCGLRSAKYEVRSTKCEMRSAKCEVRSEN